MTTAFVVPDALRKKVRPRRSVPGSATPMTEASAKRFLAHFPKSYLKKRSYPRTSVAETMTNGLAKKSHLLDLRREAHELALAPTLEKVRAASLDVLAAASWSIRDPEWLGVVAAARGLSDALRVAVKASFFDLSNDYPGDSVWLVAREGDADLWFGTGRLPWPMLRHAICAADAETYAAAVTTGRTLRATLDLGRRALIANVFPDEPWANEDLPQGKPGSAVDCEFLLAAATDAAVIGDILDADPKGHLFVSYALDLAHVLPADTVIARGAALLPVLLKKPAHEPLRKTPPRDVAAVLACYRTAEAAAVLGAYASNAVLGPIVTEYFRSAPALAKGGPVAVGRVAKRTTSRTSVGRRGKTPDVLRDRPWRPTRNAPARFTKALTMLGLDDERVDVPDVAPFDEGTIRAMAPKEIAGWRKAVETGDYACADFHFSRAKNALTYLRVPKRERLWAWNGHDVSLTAGYLALVASDGLAALPGFLRARWFRWLGQSEDDGSSLDALLCYVTPRVAPLVARVLARRKKFKKVVTAWLLAHPRVAALGLIPDAFGPEGEARKDAEAALALLALRGKTADVRSAGKAYGKDVAAAVDALLSRDPLAIGAAPPKRPAFLRIAELPDVALASGGTLDDEARDALVEMLQVASPDGYPGVARMRETCTADSLGAFALDLLEQWVLGDAPGRHEWMLFGVVHFPSDAGQRRLGSLAREWARKNQAKAVRACEALRALGTDDALMHLAHIQETTRFDALRETASSLLLEAAHERDLTLDELGDRTVPNPGLDADGTVHLSFGKRAFVVSLDETLGPVVREVLGSGRWGAPSRTFPRPLKTDDPTAATEARVRWDALTGDLGKIGDRQRRRLESALATQRTWPFEAFEAHVARHPLLRHLAMRLVWVFEPVRGKPKAFRVAEDGTYAGEDDAGIPGPMRGVVRLLHPAKDSLGRWPEIFADYELLQPFDQLVRAHREPAAAERGKRLPIVDGVVLPAKKVLGKLESRGFVRDDRGQPSAFLRAARSATGAELEVRVPISPPIDIAWLAGAGDVTLGSATVTDGSSFGALDPVSFAELVRDLEAVRG